MSASVSRMGGWMDGLDNEMKRKLWMCAYTVEGSNDGKLDRWMDELMYGLKRERG